MIYGPWLDTVHADHVHLTIMEKKQHIKMGDSSKKTIAEFIMKSIFLSFEIL